MSRIVIAIVMLSILIVVGVVSYVMYTKSKLKARMENLQSTINSVINGQIGLTNLKVVGSLNIIGSDLNDSYPLKLVSSSPNKNVITFARYGVPYNEFGILSNSNPNKRDFKINRKKEYNQPTKAEVSIDSLRRQINDIISGKTQLNNLLVIDKLTVVGGGRVKIVSENLYAINGGLSVINKSGGKMLDSGIIFGGNAGMGSYGLSKVYTNSSNKAVYDINFSQNLNYKNTNWDSRSVLPECTPRSVSIDDVSLPEQAVQIEYLELVLNKIINGNIPLNNLVVNGSVYVDSKLDSPLTLDVQSCDPTSLIGFNNLDARGVNGYGGPFDWVGAYFDPTKTISYSGKNNIININ